MHDSHGCGSTEKKYYRINTSSLYGYIGPALGTEPLTKGTMNFIILVNDLVKTITYAFSFYPPIEIKISLKIDNFCIFGPGFVALGL